MAAEYPPFMNATGNVSRILNKIKEAATPDRFTYDFLETALGFSGGSARPFIGFAKRIGLLGSDGVPTDLYKRFRNPSESGAAIAAAMKTGYGELYKRNEYAHKLDHKGLEGLVMEATGLEKGNATLRAIVGTFEALKGFADFEASPKAETTKPKVETEKPKREIAGPGELPLNLSYTLYLNLPNTSDIAVFNAIFKSLKENLFTR